MVSGSNRDAYVACCTRMGGISSNVDASEAPALMVMGTATRPTSAASGVRNVNLRCARGQMLPRMAAAPVNGKMMTTMWTSRGWAGRPLIESMTVLRSRCGREIAPAMGSPTV
jgi:hypothetical protein